jgi:hypothetical protein
LSNPFFISLSKLPSNLFTTAVFGALRNPELKVSVGSVGITSGAVGGGALVALVSIVCLVFHKACNSLQTEKQIIDEFDLSTEHRNEESDLEEHFFDLPNDRTSSKYLTGSESWEDSPNDFRMHYE